MALDSVTVVTQGGVSAKVTNSGALSMSVTLVPQDPSDPLMAKLLMDEADDPILDVLGQYIIGGP